MAVLVMRPIAVAICPAIVMDQAKGRRADRKASMRVRHPAYRHQRTQEHRDKRDVECSVAEPLRHCRGRSPTLLFSVKRQNVADGYTLSVETQAFRQKPAQRHYRQRSDVMEALKVLKAEYENYLRNQRGLSERTIYHCWRFADRFVTFRFKRKPRNLRT